MPSVPAPNAMPPSRTVSTPVSPPESSLPLLMARVAAGDRAAFAGLVAALQATGLRLADRTLNDRAAAEDVVQAALTKVWRLAAHFDPARGSVEGWFRKIVFNLCLDHRRAQKPWVPIEAAHDVASDAADPLAAALASDARTRLAAAMARLLPRQRAALALFHGDGLSMAEIAVILETTPKAVEGLLGRARMELKTLMGPIVP